MSKFKAIFFDNDGILVDTEQLYYQSCKETLEALGFSLPFEKYVEHWLIGGEGIEGMLRTKEIPEIDIEVFQEKRNDIWEKLVSAQVNPIPGVKEVVEELTSKWHLAIVTTAREKYFKICHKNTGLLRHFDFVITRDDVEKAKPDPEPYLLALKKSGFAPEECLVVEDSPRGAIAAKAAGIYCVAIPSHFTKTLDFFMADTILSDIRELPKFLKD